MMTFLFAKKFIAVHVEFSFILKTICATVVMGSCVYAVRFFNVESDLWVLLLSVFLGSLVYLMTTVILKNPLLNLLKKP